jgi:aspartate racemase
LSWESTVLYYRLLNTGVAARLGGHSSADCVIVSLDFARIVPPAVAGRFDEVGALLAAAAKDLERANAAFFLITAVTAHAAADAVQAAVRLPLLHIAEPSVAVLDARGVRRVGLLGTAQTMRRTFFRERLSAGERQVLVPPEPEIEAVNSIIIDELTKGHIEAASRARVERAIGDLVARGAEAVVLGCSELGLLIDPAAGSVPLIDAVALHAQAALDRALA